VTSSLPAELSNASDFSRSSIEARINAGYQDATPRKSVASTHPGSGSEQPGATRNPPPQALPDPKNHIQ
jgi:hypothetical protein